MMMMSIEPEMPGGFRLPFYRVSRAIDRDGDVRHGERRAQLMPAANDRLALQIAGPVEASSNHNSQFTIQVLPGLLWVAEARCHDHEAASRASRAPRGACGAPGPRLALVA